MITELLERLGVSFLWSIGTRECKSLTKFLSTKLDFSHYGWNKSGNFLEYSQIAAFLSTNINCCLTITILNIPDKYLKIHKHDYHFFEIKLVHTAV